MKLKLRLKKALISVVCVAMGVTLMACGNKNESGVGSQATKITVNNEILNADPYAHMVQIFNNKIDFPLTVEKLEQAGMQYADSNKNAIDYLMDINATAHIDFLINENVVKIYIKNDTGDYAPISACTPVSLTTSAFGEHSECLVFPGGIRVGSTKDELITAWGNPNAEEDRYNEGVVSKEYQYFRYPKSDMGRLTSYCDEKYTVTLENDIITSIQRQWSDYTGVEDVDRVATSKDGTAKLYYKRNPEVYDRIHDKTTGIITVGGNDYVVTGNSLWGYIFSYPFNVAEVNEAAFRRAITESVSTFSDDIEYKKLSMTEDDGIWVGHCTSLVDNSFCIAYALAFDNTWYHGDLFIESITPNAPITDEVKERLYKIVEDMLLSAHQE